jgi:hypothetical protein
MIIDAIFCPRHKLTVLLIRFRRLAKAEADFLAAAAAAVADSANQTNGSTFDL